MMDGSSLIIVGKTQYEDAIAGQEVNVTWEFTQFSSGCYNLDSKKKKRIQLAAESENGKEMLRV